MKTIGEIIYTNRKEKKLSQSVLAELLQNEGFRVSEKAISKWETNAREPSIPTFLTICKILGITNIYEAYFGINPDDPLSSLNELGKEKVLDYIELLHDSGKYEKELSENLVSFRRYIDIYENAVSAGTGNFLEDSPKETFELTKAIVPKAATFGVRIVGDSMEPEFADGQVAWVMKKNVLVNGEIGIFCLNGDAYIKKYHEDSKGISLISLNEKYPPIPILEHDRFDILGKVVGKNFIEEL